MTNCPDHGPMTAATHDGQVVDVRCAHCGLRPIDLLADATVTPPWADPESDPIAALNDLLRFYDGQEAMTMLTHRLPEERGSEVESTTTIELTDAHPATRAHFEAALIDYLPRVTSVRVEKRADGRRTITLTGPSLAPPPRPLEGLGPVPVTDPIRLQPCGRFHRQGEPCPRADPRCYW